MDEAPHEKLIAHLKALVTDTESYYFHDFKTDFACPKVMLIQRLEAIVENVKKGEYDN